VVRAAPDIGRKAANLRPVELRGKRRSELVGDEERPVLDLAEQIARRERAAQIHPKPSDEVDDVAFPLSKKRIRHLVEDGTQLLKTCCKAHSAFTAWSLTSCEARGPRS